MELAIHLATLPLHILTSLLFLSPVILPPCSIPGVVIILAALLPTFTAASPPTSGPAHPLCVAPKLWSVNTEKVAATHLILFFWAVTTRQSSWMEGEELFTGTNQPLITSSIKNFLIKSIIIRGQPYLICDENAHFRCETNVTYSSLTDISLTCWEGKLIHFHIIYFVNFLTDTKLAYSILWLSDWKRLLCQCPFIKPPTVQQYTFCGPVCHSQHNVLQLYVRVQEPTLWWAGQPLRLLLSEWGDVHINSS